MLAASIDYLCGVGGEFKVCNNTMRPMDRPCESLYRVEGSGIVPSGVLEMAWLANESWTVKPMY